MGRPVRPADFALYSLLSAPSFSPDGKKVVFSVRKANISDDTYETEVRVADVRSGRLIPFTSGGKDLDPSWSPDGKWILFQSKRNFGKDEKGNALYVISSAGGEARLVLKKEEGIGAAKWSPDSRSVYFISSVVKKEKDDVKVITRRTFWFNGLGFVHNKRKHLFNVDVQSGKVVQLTKGSIELSDFGVSNDGKKVAYAASTDDARPYVSDLFVLDLHSKRAKKLTRSNLEIGSPAWSPDDSRVAFVGDDFPAGFASHVSVWGVSAGGGGLARLESVDRNKSNGLNTDARAKDHGPVNIVWEKEGIYFLQADGGSVHLYLLKPGGEPALVVGGDRSVEGYDVHDGAVAFVAMDDRHPEELYFKGSKERKLTSLNAGVGKELSIVAPRRFAFKATDGETVEGWTMVPRSKRAKVPVILYVHGGPKTAFGFSYMHEFQAFAGAGYCVVYMNPRGSDGYSEKFADIRGRYGTRDYDDLMEGLDHVLKTNPRLDGARVAIAGGSYGGFMTNWAIGHTDRFRAAVTDRSISNWTSFWGTSDIGPYFTRDQIGGDPWNADEKLSNDSPLTYVQNVKTPLMLVHSMEDYRCWMVEGLQFFSALKELGREAELVLFPGESHDLSRTGKPKHRIARLNHYIRWFDTHLKSKRA
ncbi:MAG: S9 family peptidase [Thaumarchaeota archaeon]|nr:S9 family peptidase [Nitrososphaerota archaeon]